MSIRTTKGVLLESTLSKCTERQRRLELILAVYSPIVTNNSTCETGQLALVGQQTCSTLRTFRGPDSWFRSGGTPMKHTTLATTGFERYGKTTRRAVFLAKMERVVPWPALCSLIEVNPRPDAASVLRQLEGWLEHYNTIHPHRALGYRSPREFRKQLVEETTENAVGAMRRPHPRTNVRTTLCPVIQGQL
jgi:hypothetical protein